MDLLSAQDLISLSEQRGGVRISVLLPTHRAGPQTDRNRIRLKNLLRRAERTLREDGMAAAEAGEILLPARRLLEPAPWWQRPSDGLAVFLGPDGIRHFRVPVRLPELVAVGDRFLLRPLLPLLGAGGHFYVLALNQDEIRLLRGSRFRLDEVPLDGLPLAVWLTMPRRRAQVHAFVADRGGTGGRAVFHGMEEDTTALVLQHFRRVDRALREVLHTGSVPVVLAGVRSTQALYRQVSTYPRLVGEGVDGSARDLSLAHLHRLARQLAEPLLRGEETRAAGVYRDLRGTGRTCSDTIEIRVLAGQGRIETLFVCAGVPVGGAGVIRLDTNTGEIDHLGSAAVSTLRHGGTVYVVPRDRMPDGAPMAAILRL
ncbi:baeRF3 domain-containing protein [Paractinoplanes rishiriensis]|uniref:Uncharacterized protein n=1 Tax=Paractinoplanes rishiriensis TaxID=1050105 RepID=A0A919K7M1_9ACTN|nr:hypothetical protein [Actinoplanes rishiriensis]GIF00863.1 hypothetical protein Ari01nite_83270 [Actinoplanes rishiriensis]